MATTTANPFRDLDVIDSRAPRVNQATVAVVGLVALATGWWPLFALLALQLALGLVLGRRWCLPCLLYFKVIQPRLGEGPVEDSRPPRFANQVGLAMLTAASLAYALGAALLGAVLGAVVVLLAGLAATTGLCAGCELYRLLARLRGVRRGSVAAIDRAALGMPLDSEVVIHFTHPLCSECHEVERRLAGGPRPLVAVDVSRRPDLARRYHVVVVPTAYALAPDGTVLERLA